MQDMNPSAIVKDISLPLFNAKFWMKLMGVFMIIYGVLVALTIVGILIAWLPIWIGVLLFQAASAIDAAYSQGDADAAVRAADKLKVYFIINGVLLLIGIILGVIAFMMGGMAAFMGMQGMGAAGMGGML
ncbi:MAG TPA: DUF5362 family protein [Gammaproteobacteria bacterium]